MNSQCISSIKWKRRKMCSLLVFILVLSVRRSEGGKTPTSEEEGTEGGGGGGGGGSSSANGGSSGQNNNAHGSHGQHTRYDKYDKYGSPNYPSSALSYYSAYGYPTVPTNYPYNYHSYQPYPVSEPFYERTGKDFSTRASNNMPMAASASYGYGSKEVTSPEFGGLAMASGGHGHQSQGWGWGKGGGYTGSKVDTSAIGLIGLIGLLSLLQNVLFALTTTTTTTAAAGRKKRDTSDDVTVESPEKEGTQRVSDISMMVLPALNVVAHARNGRVPLECTHREVCTTNKILVKELGFQGRSVGSMISSAITKMLKEVDNTGTIGTHITKASLAGRNGHDCEVVYPLCETLSRSSEPLPILMQPTHFAQLNLKSTQPTNNNNENHSGSRIAAPKPNTVKK